MEGLGSVIGGVVGAGTSLADTAASKKARERAETTAEFGYRPKRRKVKRLQTAIQQNLNNRQRALVAMAQAHQNFASMW
jgi:hypothetical protein